MQKALPTFDNTVINAEVYFDTKDRYLKASVVDDSGNETIILILPERLLDIYNSTFVRYMRFGVKCPALIVRGKNPDYIEEAPDEYPEYLYKVVSFNDIKAETQYQAIIAKQDGIEEGYADGYNAGKIFGMAKGKYYGAKQLGDHLKDFMQYTEITENNLIIEINNQISDLYDEVIEAYPEAFLEE